MAQQIISYPANVPCPICGGLVHDWHTEWTDPKHGPDFYKGLRSIDCPICGGWVLYKERRIQSVPAGHVCEKTKRSPLQGARWAKSQSREGNLRGYLDQTEAGKQYRDYFTDKQVDDADAEAQADPRY